MACAAAARAVSISRAADLSLKSTVLSTPQLPNVIRIRFPTTDQKKLAIVCLISGFDGGVSDEFVSTRKSSFGREFSVVANMLKRIEPLDNSIISEGVSQSAKNSMKQTISTMLGLLPSDQFSVTVSVSNHPLNHLIVSSIITGYTLWNAEYRISLIRNFNIPTDDLRRPHPSDDHGNLMVKRENGGDRESEKGDDGGPENDEGVEVCGTELEKTNLQNLLKLSPDALRYILQLESELSTIQQEVNAQKQINLEMEHMRRTDDDLLEYLRSLESDMVNELSKPSSPEVEEIIKQLAQSALQRFFRYQITSDYTRKSNVSSIQNHQSMEDHEQCDFTSTSRDSLAKLLFCSISCPIFLLCHTLISSSICYFNVIDVVFGRCMLLGHHLRGLENRMQLSCVVGLL